MLVAGQDRLGARVGEALAASDDTAVEERLAGREAGVEEHFHSHAAAVLVGAQAAEVGREQLRKHRLDPARHVRGEGAVGRVLVEGRAGRDIGAHVGDVDPGANALPLAAEAQGVVEVFRLVGVDREREEVAQVGSVRLDLFGRRRNRCVRASHPLVPEQSLQHRADVSGAAEHRLDFRPSPPEAENDEVARGRIAAPLAVDRDGDAALEEWLAHQELPAPGELGDQRLHVATRRACRPARARPRGSSRHAPSADRCPPSRKAECPGRRGPFPTASDTWPSSA